MQLMECEFGGLERWNGTVEWSTGLDPWTTGVPWPSVLHNQQGCIDPPTPPIPLTCPLLPFFFGGGGALDGSNR